MEFSKILLCTLMAAGAFGDIYFHNPRGSNDRLISDLFRRANGNRLFDSQNNAKGGYNVGEAGTEPANNESEFYRMIYFQSGINTGEDSLLTLEMSYQHGCETDELKCEIIIQYMCQPENENSNWEMRDGIKEEKSTFTPPRHYEETAAQRNARRTRDSQSSREMGQHESWDSYNHCYLRYRNDRLFAADQRLRTNELDYTSAIFTRQNSKGDRYGWECSEERDHYPYWHPSQWKDILVWTDTMSDCPNYVRNSFSGTKTLGVCTKADGTRDTSQLMANSPENCTSSGSRWVQVYNYLEKVNNITSQLACLSRSTGYQLQYIWGVPYDAENFNSKECLVPTPKVKCEKGPWSKANHLGIDVNTNEFPRYEWKIPYFPSGTVQKCVLRARYNITNYGDFEFRNIDSSSNQVKPAVIAKKYQQLFRQKAQEIRNWQNGTRWQDRQRLIENYRQEMKQKAHSEIINGISPVRQSPRVELYSDFPEIALAINSDQTGRVFQDRTHVFLLAPRPTEIPSGRKIYNLNVRGKRGNIVQAYNAVEYDFVPNNLSVTPNDLIHIQWTGSNHQFGDGQGQRGTDRNNIVQIENYAKNYPLAGENITMWRNAKVYWTPFQSPELFNRLVINNKRGFIRKDPFSTRAWSLETSRFLNNFIQESGGWRPPSRWEPRWSYADAHPYDIEKNLDDGVHWRMKRQAIEFHVGPMELTDRQLALALMTSGYYWCVERSNCPSYVPNEYVMGTSSKPLMGPSLSEAPASFQGVVLSLSRGTFYYMSSRNNKFTNRSQKGRIFVQ